MVLKELAKLFGKALFSSAYAKGYEQVENRLKKVVQDRKIQQYIGTLEMELLSKHGDEKYYNDLSKFLCHPPIMVKIMKRCYDRDIFDVQTPEQFLNSLITSYPYSHHNVNRVKEIIATMINVAVKHFNSDLSDKDRQIKNIALTIGDILNSNMIQYTNVVQKDLKDITETVRTIESTLTQSNTVMDTSELGKLNQTDIKSFIAGEISISGFLFEAPNSYVTISTRICYDATRFNAQTFDQLIAYLRFCGKQQEFDVAEMTITTNNGSELFSYKKPEYNGIVLQLPDVQVKKVDGIAELRKSVSMKVCIFPKIEKLRLAIEDDSGNELLAPEEYHIERRINGNTLFVSFISSSIDLMADININFQIENHDFSSIKADIEIKQKKNAQVINKLRWLQGLYNICAANSFTLYNKVINQCLMKSSSAEFQSADHDLDSLRNSIALYKKLVHIERILGIKFEADYPFDENDQYWIDTVDHLLENNYMDHADCTISIPKPHVIGENMDFTESEYAFIVCLNLIIGNTKIELKETPCLVGQAYKLESDETTHHIYLRNCKVFLSSLIADEVDIEAKRFEEAKKYFSPISNTSGTK